MNTTQLIALTIAALIILALIIAFRKRIAVTLKAWGINLSLEGENETKNTAAPPDTPPDTPPPAGVSVKDAKSTEGGLLIEEGSSATGTGVQVEGVEVKDDIIIGKGKSGADDNAPKKA